MSSTIFALRILIASDTHRKDEVLKEVIDKEAPFNMLIHLEDTIGNEKKIGPVNFSGRLFKTVFYGVDRETGRINYDEVEALAAEHRPKLIVAGASAYPCVLDFARFRAIADTVGAKLLVDMAQRDRKSVV